MTTPALLSPLRSRRPAVVGLLVLAPVSAEYLVGYGESTGRPWELIAGLLILAPLYGAPALLVRELVRRTGRGWPTILVLGAAFGVVQAGLVDQSLFFRIVGPGDPAWAGETAATLVPGTGVDAARFLNYVGGHMIWSIAAPIAVVEACAPRLARRRWLGPAGLVVAVLLWAGAAALVHSDAAAGSTATAAQLVVAAVLAATLVVAAFTYRPAAARTVGQAPPWWIVGVLTAGVLAAYQLLPATWAWTAAAGVALLVLGWLLGRWSRQPGWGGRHVLAAAGAALLVRAGISFLVEPLGDVDLAAKYAVNAAILAGVIALLAWAAHRVTRTPAPPC